MLINQVSGYTDPAQCVGHVRAGDLLGVSLALDTCLHARQRGINQIAVARAFCAAARSIPISPRNVCSAVMFPLANPACVGHV